MAEADDTPAPTIDEIRSWGATTDVPTAGAVFGVGRNKAYELVKAGQFPVPVMKIGATYRVAVGEILRVVAPKMSEAPPAPVVQPHLPGPPVRRKPDKTITKAAEAAPRVLGEYIGHAVAVVLMDHSEDEAEDPNIHELAYRILRLTRL